MNCSRDEFVQDLKQSNVGASIHYRPLHTVSHYNSHSNLDNTENIYERILTVPISSSISLDDAAYVTEQIHLLMQQHSD
jgi:dTDP-4-amino-4,6-dideoxygalactose transaminase